MHDTCSVKIVYEINVSYLMTVGTHYVHMTRIILYAGVKLILRGVEYPQNVTVSIMDIGEGDAALACQTDRRPCCRSNRIGEWYFPNGSLVRTEGHGDDFYRNRGDNGTVRLNRRGNSVAYPEGTFRCVVPDANNISRTIYVGLVKYG